MQLYNPHKIKILYLIDFLTGFAGTERHLYLLCNELIKKGHQCTIVAFSTPPIKDKNNIDYKNYIFLMEQFKKIGVTIITYPIPVMYAPSSVKKFIKLVSIIRSNNPDIVQTFHFVADTFGVLAAKTAGIKKIISSRRDMGDLKEKKHILLNIILNRYIDRFIAVCSAVKNKIAVKEHIKSNKITVVYNGIDTAYFCKPLNNLNRDKLRSKLGCLNEDFVIGIACIFRPEKGIDIFFKAITNVCNKISNIKVLAVGEGQMKNKMMDYCKEKKIEKKVIFVGYVNDVRHYLPAVDIVCMVPKKNEGFSNVILEEMAMELPIIATNIGGNAEQIVDKESGIIIQADNSVELENAIMIFYQNKELRKVCGKNAKKRVEEEFTISKMADRTEAVYRAVLGI